MSVYDIARHRISQQTAVCASARHAGKQSRLHSAQSCTAVAAYCGFTYPVNTILFILGKAEAFSQL